MGLFGKKQAPPPPSMLEITTKMRFTSKQVGRHAAKSEKQVVVEERKSKEALAKGNVDVARIHGTSGGAWGDRNARRALGWH
jgi:hypothetical protein